MQSPTKIGLYYTDFFAWTEDTAEKLRTCRFQDIDLEALAAEIEDLGKRERHEVNSRLTTIILHLLKLPFQPEKPTTSWTGSIARERGELEDIFEQSPTLRAEGLLSLPKNYRRALNQAIQETMLPKKTFPAECLYTYDQLLDNDFFLSKASI